MFRRFSDPEASQQRSCGHRGIRIERQERSREDTKSTDPYLPTYLPTLGYQRLSDRGTLRQHGGCLDCKCIWNVVCPEPWQAKNCGSKMRKMKYHLRTTEQVCLAVPAVWVTRGLRHARPASRSQRTPWQIKTTARGPSWS